MTRMWAPKFKFYHDEPLFGLDIGHTSMKVMQLQTQHVKIPQVIGYGVSKRYPENVTANGVIVDYKTLSESIHELFEHRLIGSISSKRVVCTIPTSHTFSRPMKLPPLQDDDIAEAVHLEAEQYIPVPTSNLYLDYEISRRDELGIELVMVATPKNIVDSYIKFLDSVGLEPIAFEPTMTGAARLFKLADPANDKPSVLIDFGSTAIDIAVFDKVMFVNSTINGGSDDINEKIAEHLGVSYDEAFVIKCKYGIAYSDKIRDISSSIKPTLDSLVREVRKIIRYYNERNPKKQSKIAQVVTLGGGGTMHGLSEYLTRELETPTRILNPWHKISFSQVLPPHEFASTLYITVASAAILDPKEVFS